MPDWPALVLINQCRFFLLLVIAGVYYAADHVGVLGSRDATLFEIAHLFWTVLALGFTYLIRIKTPSAEVQLYAQSYLDMLCITVMLYASGGISSGMGLLLLLGVALLAQLVKARMALLFAAIGTLMLFSEELLSRYLHTGASADLERSAMLGIALFSVAWLISVPVRRLSEREISVPTQFRAGLDIEQIAHLNEEIVQELDSGVLVVDSSGHIQVMNDSARILLACEFVALPAPLRIIAPELFDDMNDFCLSPGRGSRPVSMLSCSQVVLPHYSGLSRRGMLIRLEDHRAIISQFQQLKLASLGRLSASIAHEIRNPLGALSHAVQLAQESPGLSDEDRGLLDVALRQSGRIDRIINDVLQVSSAKQTSHEAIPVLQALETFRRDFITERGLDPAQLRCHGSVNAIAVADADQLDRIMWNLCNNALLHNSGTRVDIDITIAVAESGSVTIDVCDNGKGISSEDAAQLFEPFYSTSHEGTGLGLFIVRELCTANNGSIECLPSDSGATFRITLPGAAVPEA